MTHAIERMNLSVDLKSGIVPISKAASSLASLLKRARERRQPIVITQKGYPTAVLLPIELYDQLRERAKAVTGDDPPPATAGPEG